MNKDSSDKTMLKNEEFCIDGKSSEAQRYVIDIETIESLLYLFHNYSYDNILIDSYPCSFKGTYCIVEKEKIGYVLDFDVAVE